MEPHSSSVMNILLYFLPRCWKYFHTTPVNVKYHFISKCLKFRGNSTRGYQKERLTCCSGLLKITSPSGERNSSRCKKKMYAWLSEKMFQKSAQFHFFSGGALWQKPKGKHISILSWSS